MKDHKTRRRGWISKRYEPLLFPLLLSGFMTLLITGISVGRVLGLGSLVHDPRAFTQTWVQSYLAAWLIAYPILLLVTPLVRRIVNRLTGEEPAR